MTGIDAAPYWSVPRPDSAYTSLSMTDSCSSGDNSPPILLSASMTHDPNHDLGSSSGLGSSINSLPQGTMSGSLPRSQQCVLQDSASFTRNQSRRVSHDSAAMYREKKQLDVDPHNFSRQDSWRSDVELAGVFPEEAEPNALEAFRGRSQRRRQSQQRSDD